MLEVLNAGGGGGIVRYVELGVKEGEVEIINRVVMIGPIGKMTFELRLKEGGC